MSDIDVLLGQLKRVSDMALVLIRMCNQLKRGMAEDITLTTVQKAEINVNANTIMTDLKSLVGSIEVLA